MPTDKRTPSPGGVSGWSPESGPGLEEATGLLASTEFTVVGRLPWSSNLTFLVTLDTGDADPVCAVYKPARGERSLWDFPGGLYRREVAAFELSEALGWGLVPPTVARDDGPFGQGSLQLFVEADYHQHYFTLFDEGRDEDALRAICAFDIVANNADRKSGHVLRGADGRLWAIDHGLCFHRHPKLRTVIWDFADDTLSGEMIDDLGRLASADSDHVGLLLAEPERAAIRERAGHLIDARSFPEPDGDRPPYPWPLV